jgi:hypothetical protein
MSAFCGEPAEGEAKLSLDVPPPPSESETEGLKQMVALLRDAGAAEAAGAPVDDPLYSDERALLRYLRARKGGEYCSVPFFLTHVPVGGVVTTRAGNCYDDGVKTCDRAQIRTQRPRCSAARPRGGASSAGPRSPRRPMAA